MDETQANETISLDLEIRVREEGAGWVASVPALGIAARGRTREDAVFRARASAIARAVSVETHPCSPRGIPLVCGGVPDEGCPPVVTVEDHCKWYELYVVHPGGKVEPVHFGHLEPAARERGISTCADHAPNPSTVWRWAESMGYEVDDESLERMAGRWVLERDGRYTVEQLEAIER